MGADCPAPTINRVKLIRMKINDGPQRKKKYLKICKELFYSSALHSQMAIQSDSKGLTLFELKIPGQRNGYKHFEIEYL